MADLLSIPHFALTLFVLVGAASSFAKAISSQDPLRSLLVGAVGLATAGYLLCDLNLAQSAQSISEIVAIEKISVGIALLIYTLCPWIVSRAPSRSASGLIFALSGVALALLFANYVSENSLRFDKLALPESSPTDRPTPVIERSPWLAAYATFVLAVTVSLLREAISLWRHHSALREPIFLAAASVALFLATAIELVQILMEHYPIRAEWFGIAGVWAYLFASKRDREQTETETKSPATAQTRPTPETAIAEADKSKRKTDETAEEEAPPAPSSKEVTLLWFPDGEADFLSKILHSRNFIVHRANRISDLPTSIANGDKSLAVVFFNRDAHPEVPYILSKLRRSGPFRPCFVALTAKSQNALYQQELRAASYEFLLTRPPKASELLRFLDTLATRRYPLKSFKSSPNGS